jgi:hypothetical protein
MQIKMTLPELLHIVTFIVFLILGGVFLMRREFLVGILLLGWAVLYLMIRNKKSLLSPKPELTTTESATRIATAWMGILLFIVVFILEVPNQYWILAIPVPIFLLFLWMVLTGR